MYGFDELDGGKVMPHPLSTWFEKDVTSGIPQLDEDSLFFSFSQ
jgi:uncharacterized protein (DUF1015 family)